MNLPAKDKNGTPYLSWSQIDLFLTNKKEYYKRYILGEEFKGNAYTEFGSIIGSCLESGDFSSLSKVDQETMSLCKRLDIFEQPVFLRYDNFYVLGYIDTCTNDFSEIIDYKTGSVGKHQKYTKDNYWQLCYYALAIKQQTGSLPSSAKIQYIHRDGNAFKGQKLTLSKEPPLLFDVDISLDRLKKIYWGTIDIAKRIEYFYEQNK